MRRYFKTIKGKIVASVVFIHTLLMLFFITDNTVRDYNLMLNQATKTVHNMGSIMAANASSWLLSKDLVALKELIKSVESADGFDSAYILELSGNVVASSDSSYLNSKLTDRYSLELLELMKANENSCVEIKHHDLIDTIHPIKSHGVTIGFVRVLFDYKNLESALEKLIAKAVIYSLVAVALGALFAWMLMEALSKRIKALTRSAAIISQGHLDVDIPVAKGYDEVDMLTRALKKMQTEINKKMFELGEVNSQLESKVEREVVKRREQEQILIQQSKLASMGEMINAIAHQWRQPLNALVLLVQDLEDAYDYGQLDKEYLGDSVKKTLEIARFMSGTIDDFRNFFRPTKEAKEFDLALSIDEVLKIMESQLKNNNIEVAITKPDDGAMVWGYPNEFKQVIVNILNNARQAILEQNRSGKITIAITKESGYKRVRICDDGVGIEPEKIGKIFEPYYTTKLDSGGTGIGLYMSKMIIEKNMKGKLDLIPQEIGACFEIVLPIS